MQEKPKMKKSFFFPASELSLRDCAKYGLSLHWWGKTPMLKILEVEQ